MGRNSMRDKVKKSVPQEATGGEAEEDLEQSAVLTGILQGDEEEYQERSSTDESSGGEGVEPEFRGALNWTRESPQKLPLSVRVRAVG